MCKTHRCETLIQVEEDRSTLRDKISHNEDFESDDSSKTGIKTESVLNRLPSFNISDCVGVDTFHDLHEGVAHYTTY